MAERRALGPLHEDQEGLTPIRCPVCQTLPWVCDLTGGMAVPTLEVKGHQDSDLPQWAGVQVVRCRGWPHSLQACPESQPKFCAFNSTQVKCQPPSVRAGQGDQLNQAFIPPCGYFRDKPQAQSWGWIL